MVLLNQNNFVKSIESRKNICTIQ